MPSRMACRGERGRTARPSIRISPRSGRVMPNSISATSERPAPTRPKKPRISPARRSKLTSSTKPAPESPRTLEHRRADLGRLLGEEGARLGADHVPHRLLRRQLRRRAGDRRAAPSAGSSPRRPCRRISSMKWLMNRMATPCRLRRTHDLEQPVDLAARYRRGGLVHDEHARIERQRPDDLDRLTLGDAEHLHRQCGRRSRMSRRASSSPRLGAHRRPVDPAPRRGWRPMKTFSATERSGKSAGCWWTTAIPWRWASAAPRMRRSPPRPSGCGRRRAGGCRRGS